MIRFANLVRIFAFSALLFAGTHSDAEAQTFRRTPFLQLGTPTSASVCWRLTTQTSLTVRYGTDSTNLNLTSAAGVADSNACVSLTGLSPATKYYYKLYNGVTEVPGVAEQYLVTHPVENSTAKHRFWVIGDFGEGDALQAGVRRGFVAANGGNHIDGILMLGDNAYSSGTDAEYTTKLFAMYPDIMANTFAWPVMGNHDAITQSGGPYLASFTLPSNGQSGGVASGTELYYSFDYGNIHFICLDSEISNRTTTGPQYLWLQQDLQATTKKWIVVTFHHPPYTRGSHNSETESKHVDMRFNYLPLLETYGVDLVLGGHSHVYERSYLLDSAYSVTGTTLATHNAWYAANRTRVIVDSSAGDPEDQGPYRKTDGANQGAVYSVVGSSANLEGGQAGGKHPMHYTQQFRLGSAIMEVEGDIMTVKFYDSSGIYHDRYQIVKSEAPFTVAYAANPATYTVGSAITTNTASSTRSGASYSVNPALPAGLSLNGSTGAITGTPTGAAVAANYTVTATVGEESAQAVVNITVNPFVLSYASNPATYVLNNAITANTATPTGAGFSYSVNPSLPAGLSLNTSTGAITGTPSVLSSAADYTVTATYGSVSDDAIVSIAVLTTLPSDFSTWGSNVDIQLNTTTAAAGVATSQAGFPMLVRLNGRHAAVFNTAQSGGVDVRFTNANGVRLPTQVESWSFVPGDTSAAIWVRLDTARANTTTTVRMYWNKPGALADTLANQVFDTLSYGGVWHMGTGTNVSDATTNGLTATNFSTTTGTGAIGIGRVFNGSTQYLSVASSAKIHPTTSLTMSAWVRANTWSGASVSRRILEKSTSSTTQYGMRDNTSNNIQFTVGGTASALAQFANPDTLVWVLIHGAWDGTNVRSYLNGALKATSAKAGPITANTTALDIGRASGSNSANTNFSGSMDEVRIQKVARSADWNLLEYRTQKPGTFPIYGLAYSNSSPTYTVSQGISSNMVASLFGTATRFTASGLPAGLAINGTTGAITGTPSAAGAYGVTVTAYGDSAWSATATVNMTVILPPPAFTYASPQSYGFGSAISALNPNSTGSTVTAWSINPALPTGLSFNTSSGAITGTPTAVSAAANYTIIGTNANGADTAVVNIATPAVVPNAPTGVAVAPGGARAFVSWTAASFNGGAAITGYTVTAAPGGATCAWTAGPLACIVTGLSNGTGYTFTVTAQNSVGSGTASAASSSVTPGPAPVISYVGAPYTFPMGIEVSQPVTNSGTSVTSWSVAPNLAANTGLQINSITGRIVGTPVYLTSATTYTITAVNAAGVQDRTTISIATPAVKPNISYATPQVWPMGTAIATFAPSNSGGAVLSWSISPNLTANTGLLFSTLTGKIIGTPVYVSPATDYTVIVNGNGGTADTTVVNIATVSAPPILSYPGGPYTFELFAPISTLAPINSGAAVLSWSMTPNLNAATGLLFNPTTGRISGTPAYIAAAADYTVIATAAGGASDTVLLSIATSTPAPTVSYTNALLDYAVGSEITPLSKTGATGIITGYTVAPALPSGLAINPTTGRISGRPATSTAAADYIITVHGPGGTGSDTVHIATTTAAPTVSYTNTPQSYTVGNTITTLTKLGATGIVSGYSIAPALPAGLVFNPTTGAILGTPSAASPATDYVVSANGPGGTGRDTVNITVTTPAPTVSYSNTPQSYLVGSAITPFSKSGATGLISGYSILPNLTSATGLSFSTTTGRIEGTPTLATATTDYVITVHGPGGTGKDTVHIATTVNAPNIAFAVPSVSFVTGTPIEAFRPVNTGGMITGWGISAGSNGASLTSNTGLQFNPTTGKILGTPVYVSAPRDYTVTASGLSGSFDSDVITIATTAPLGKLVAGEANTFSFRVTGAMVGSPGTELEFAL